MPLQYKFFSIPVKYEEEGEKSLNKFLNSVRMIDIQRELVCQENRFYWSIVVEYATEVGKGGKAKSGSGKNKIDYMEVLPPEEFAIYSKLRDWRKKTAINEGIQLYEVFMNDQLAAMVQKRVNTKEGLRRIENVGDSRVKKYGDAVLEILRESFKELNKKNETDQEPVRSDTDI